jgi:hypothetical protein
VRDLAADRGDGDVGRLGRRGVPVAAALDVAGPEQQGDAAASAAITAISAMMTPLDRIGPCRTAPSTHRLRRVRDAGPLRHRPRPDRRGAGLLAADLERQVHRGAAEERVARADPQARRRLAADRDRRRRRG